ncbi:hypothetical protein D9613_010601 [Agrocybe pediades]|uniref:Uncharacterized protein n=1 Tax=Agrocybe pediades TaxID=84607 RepID=A0A8H4QFP6_9AGAR|nr:hypothetical protein D9613_010601 [Agrocybe pediades]
MDVDPLAGDSIPPRYAIESDEEEDEINPLRPQESSASAKVEVKVLGDIPTGNSLFIASGDSGKLWAKGAELGEQSGSVMANGVQIGLVFNPSWTRSSVIISETFSRLPLFAMNPYAKAILDTLQPSSLSLLDTYPTPTYASDKVASFYDSPLRYLSTSIEADVLDEEAHPFSPPNLNQSTSAAFLAIASTISTQATLLLLPTPHISPSPPKEISSSNFSSLSRDDIEWTTEQINTVQRLAFKMLGQEVDHPWVAPEKQAVQTSKKSTEIGEGGMYI